jgi:uncharacterized RDD family membrane protein YckC
METAGIHAGLRQHPHRGARMSARKQRPRIFTIPEIRGKSASVCQPICQPILTNKNLYAISEYKTKLEDYMTNKAIPLEIEGITEKFYSGFWSRLGANLLDGLISIPYSFLLVFIDSLNKYVYLFTIIPNLIFIFWYNIYLPKRYGGTPGKLIVGIRIVKIDSSPIDWKESFLRYSVTMTFSVIAIAMTAMAVLVVDDEIYNSLRWFQKTAYLSSVSNNNIITTLSSIWFWSEIVVLLFNKRKRAIHDFIAGTVIVKSEYIEKIRNKMAELNVQNYEI